MSCCIFTLFHIEFSKPHMYHVPMLWYNLIHRVLPTKPSTNIERPCCSPSCLISPTLLLVLLYLQPLLILILIISDPNFVSSFALGDFVYFFFREIAVEYLNCGKVGAYSLSCEVLQERYTFECQLLSLISLYFMRLISIHFI